MSGRLQVVATPLGNLADLSPRAAEALRTADVVYAEDTRRTRGLLSHLGASVPLRSLHEHNERERTNEVVGRIAAGARVVLVSDAGTPAVSDPGADLVAAVAAAGHRVEPLPGPSALVAALSVAGFRAASSDVSFLGFPPAKGKARRAWMGRAAAQAGLVVFYEAPHRIGATLSELAEREAERPAVLARELTKVHEEVVRGTVGTLRQWAEGEVRGEITVVLGPQEAVEDAATPDEAAVDAALQRCLDAGLSARDAATAVAAVMELPRRGVYARCQALKE